MKIKSIVAAILMSASLVTFAGSLSVGADGYAGSVVSGVTSVSSGNAVAGTEIIGNGYSKQSTVGDSGGYSFAGGNVSNSGVSVDTSTSDYAHVKSVGASYGNAPAMSGTSIANGTGGLANTSVNATAIGAFEKIGVGAIGSLHIH